jgi:hypothetical protein
MGESSAYPHQGEFIPPGKLKRIHLLQAELDSRPQMSYKGAS